MKQIYEYKFLIEGALKEGSAFSEEGRGIMKVEPALFDDEVKLQAEMVKDAIDTFVSVTQPVKKYTSIQSLSVSVFDIQKRR